MTSTPAIPTTTLGDDLEVSVIGYGAMVLSPTVYGEVDDDASLATLHHAVDAGVTFLDTADVYGAGHNERLISRLLADRRDDVQLATKFGIAGNPADRAAGTPPTRGDAAYVRAAADASLERLGTDVIDLYYMHRRDARVPIEETVGAMAELVTAGKVRHLGLSEVTATELRAAHAVHPIAAVQSEWSVWSRDVEGSVVPTAAELGVGFVPYSPLGRGFLTGTLASGSDLGERDFRRLLPRFGEANLEANLAVVDGIRAIGTELGATPAQVALAWLYAKGRALGLPVVPIPGSRRAARVEENAGALRLTLTPDQVSGLDSLADAVVGHRSEDPNWVSEGRERTV
ncbi:aldo/keto reductase [Beutenbergia cavernae DSM 12333]|uniref:Aldo/keto reductase n=1 Tax=Beutenbergia cavernae (strain ATCC BAA-8 / DSM 12333 / CCUG 43141 / JCM 11478 / NBRC 16432 / NCIMB 13614 / HKI 0122) TaxID=471853 RepID=C5C2C5_BEUC1|nr:aldo/keto reductase [Beutenbergia cavernae]ACQ81750.1 aldo/keto reductase [Beutenbergia cavernae DSM 12333]